MARSTVVPLVEAIRKNRLLEPAKLEELSKTLQFRFADPKTLAKELMTRGWLTPYQVNALLQGRGHELLLGQYVLLERLGAGGWARSSRLAICVWAGRLRSR